MLHPLTVAQLLFLIIVANATPIVAKRLMGDMLAQPLDGGLRFFDGRPLLGGSKTLRGVLLSLIVTALVAPLADLEWHIGGVIAATAMAGDLLSSFIKRRLGLAPSSRAIGLDQIPEVLFPMIAGAGVYGLSMADIALAVAVFFLGEVVVSRLLDRMRLRDRPR
jgi:CDP-2,3-bis-(O-geranylgeranyl)-sn-glycerol synthase